MPIITPATEEEILSTVLKDKSDAWIQTRNWIHAPENRKTARVDIVALCEKHPELAGLKDDPLLWMRPEQYTPMLGRLGFREESYLINLMLCGRGYGKSYFSSLTVIERAMAKKETIGIMAPTYSQVRDVNFWGPSGIVTLLPDSIRDKCVINKANLSITFPNGSTITSFSAENYDTLRGNGFSFFLADELAMVSKVEEVLEAIKMVMRIGTAPEILITTTPRGIKAIRELHEDPDVGVIIGTTYDNYFLPDSYVKTLEKGLSKRMFRQEVMAEILDDVQGALFFMRDIEATRISFEEFCGLRIRRVVVAVDPSGSDSKSSDATGIVVAALGEDGKFYVVEDETMEAVTPEKWGRKVVGLYQKYKGHIADVRIVAEKNFGGLMCKTVITAAAKDVGLIAMPPVKLVNASRGKAIRAEPISFLYEVHSVCHVGDHLEELEEEMTEWSPADPSARSPNRLDACVWALTELSTMSTNDISVSYGGSYISATSYGAKHQAQTRSYSSY